MWRQALNDSFQAENRPSDPDRHTSKHTDIHNLQTQCCSWVNGRFRIDRKHGSQRCCYLSTMLRCVGGELVNRFVSMWRVSDNDPLVTVASVSRLQSAFHLSRSLYGQKSSKHTHRHTRVTSTPPLSDTAVHTNKPATALKPVASKNKYLGGVRTRSCFLCYTQSDTNTRVSARA